MTTYTDSQLKQALAKLLPEQLGFELGRLLWLEPIGPKGASFQVFVSDTELLHLCWLVEQQFDFIGAEDYGNELGDYGFSSSWQQRVIALAKVKGVEIV